MKAIEFKQKASQNIYSDYLRRIEKTIKTLPEKDRMDTLMEFNSHIYEAMQDVDAANEKESLEALLEKLGQPEEVLKPLVAEKKMKQATRTFNPIHIFQALVLNITNGITYVIFSILYLLLFSGVILAIAKVFYPIIGCYYEKDKYFILGVVDEENAVELLWNWFIPVMLVSITVLYFAITLLLKFKRKLNNKENSND